MAAVADVAHPLSYPALAPRFVNVTKPARSYIPTTRLAPSGCCIEITAICRRPSAPGRITRIDDGAQGWLAPAAIEYNGFVFTSTLAGNMPGRLDILLSIPEQVFRLKERLCALPPLRQAGLDSVAFAALQIDEDADLAAVRWAFEAVGDYQSIAISPVVVQAPLVWARGLLQGDFICAV